MRVLTAAIIAISLISTSAIAQAVCNKRETVLEHLAAKYKEAPVGMGLASNGAVLEILSSKEGTSWTIIATQANGISCVIAAGESWITLKYENPKTKPEL